MVKVLISDKMSDLAEENFRNRNIHVDVKTGLNPEELIAIIGDYDGLAVRSSTKVTPEILKAAKNLKVIGRAGIGVDNIDIKESTKSGVVVMNTPFGNAITTAEHTIALMFSLARRIPAASQSTHAGKWEKTKFMGRELFGKTLGIIGCGNIGSIVADRAMGLKMKVIAFDPFLTEDRAIEIGVKKVELDELLGNADFITMHVPLNDKTRGILNAETIAKAKKGVNIINCARGGLIDEKALKDALDTGHVAGAALDVFEVEPATENALFGHKNVVCTPHLGASTEEAQVNVAVQVADQLSDYLLNGAVTNAINMPSVSAKDAPKLKPYMKLSEQLGALLGQINQKTVNSIEIEYQGYVSELNIKPLTSVIIAGFLSPSMETINIVSAPNKANELGITLTETLNKDCNSFQTLIKVTVKSDEHQHVVTGTLFGDKNPRIVMLDNVAIEAELTKDMLFIRNIDKPGLIGALGTVLADAEINIAGFKLGRIKDSEKAIAIIQVDETIPNAVLNKIRELPQIERAEKLSF